MEDRRNLYRFFPPFLNDQYFSREEKGSREQCVIFNISRKGVGLKFHTDKKIKPGATIYLEMYIPGESEPISLKGTLKWIEKEGSDFIGAIELTEALDDATWAKLF